MLSTVERALGRGMVKGIVPVVIRSDFTKRSLTEKVNRAIRKIAAKDGVIILTELYGSTQCNICRDLLIKGEVEMVSGYNMPMLIKAATLNQEKSLAELVKILCQTAKKYICSFAA